MPRRNLFLNYDSTVAHKPQLEVYSDNQRRHAVGGMIVTMKPNTDIQYGCDIQSCGRHGFFLMYMRFSPGCPEWSQAPEYHYL